MDEITGEYIDRTVNIEMRFGSGLPRGVTHKLYAAARAHFGAPLSFLAAQALRERVRPGDRVLIVTGAGSWPWLPYGETDGPLGAAALARSLDIALGAKPVLIAEERNLGPVEAAAVAAGILIADRKLFDARTGVALSVPFPLGSEAGLAETKRIFADLQPAAVIFVEKAGPNHKGLFHSLLGTSRSPDIMLNAQHLTEYAADQGVLTIGIGDGGNETGYGTIVEAVREIQPFGRVSKTPEGGGIATTAKTDFLISAAVSNWGAYSISAMLASMLKQPEILHDSQTERAMLDACLRAGGMDGGFARLVPFVDGLSAEAQTSIVTILREIVVNSLKSFDRPF